MLLKCFLEGSSGRLGGSGGPRRGPLGAPRGPLEGFLGPPWGRLGGFSGALGIILKGRVRDVSSYSPSRASHEPLGAFFGHLQGPSGRLGAVLGRLGPFFGASWDVLGRSWVAFLAVLDAVKAGKASALKVCAFLKELRHAGLLGPSRRSAGNTLGLDRRRSGSRLLRCLSGPRPHESCRVPICTTRVWAAMSAQITNAQMGPGHHWGLLANRSATSPNGGCATTVAESPRVAPAAAQLYAREIALDQWIVDAARQF